MYKDVLRNIIYLTYVPLNNQTTTRYRVNDKRLVIMTHMRSVQGILLTYMRQHVSRAYNLWK